MLDIVIALAALVFFAPVMLAAALAVAASNSGPILFRQQRIGHGGVMFTCFKFRTMRCDAAEVLDALLAACPETRKEWQTNHKLQNDPRIIGAGRFLRKTSLDELPQLFNVLAGDMAIVGPRPIVPSEITCYGRQFRHYCAIRPGITGLWQVRGRSSTTYRRRVACDVMYRRLKSPIADLWIIACTVPAVLLGRGAC
jgi:lipopolysaccharide/colanic/teichoic acid biosynthesis glycosyltransferase